MIDATLIKPDILIGTYPQNEVDLDRLMSGPKITAVLNLQTDNDFRTLRVNWAKFEHAYKARGMLCQRWPIVDLSPSSLENRLEGAVDVLDQLLGDGHRVYVHCSAGIGRAPAVVMGYLAWYQGMGLKAAIELVKRLRPCAPYIDSIFLVHMSKTFNSGSGTTTV